MTWVKALVQGSTLPEAQAYLKELSVEFDRKGWTYRQQDNRGPGAARNLGAGFAKVGGGSVG